MRRGTTKREQKANLRPARAQARANLAEPRLALAHGERPDPARARRSVGVQPDLWHEATKEKARRSNSTSYESAVRLHVDRYPIARAARQAAGRGRGRWLGELRAAGVMTAIARRSPPDR
jgi:hypothetical protein